MTHSTTDDMHQEEERTILERGCRFGAFLFPAALLAAAAALALAKLRPPGVLLTMIPVRTVRAAMAILYAEWAAIATAAILGLRRMTALSRIRYVITTERLIRITGKNKGDYIPIREIYNAMALPGTFGKKDVEIRSAAGTVILKDVSGPDSFIETLTRAHDGEISGIVRMEGNAEEQAREKRETRNNPETDILPSRGKEREDMDKRQPERIPDPLTALDSLIGLHSVKEEVRSLKNFITVQKMRQERGIPAAEISLHTVFTGNPGTGKTTVARIMASIYYETGMLPRGHLVEVDRSGLVAEYVGQTAAKTSDAVDRAIGGVLFVDEAYSLTEGSTNDYGQEAVTTLLKRMEDDRGRFAVILAGYTDNMERFMLSNPGLKSRFPRTIHFPDYTDTELLDIFVSFCNNNGYTLSPDAASLLSDRLAKDVRQKDKRFGNGRHVRNLFEEAIKRQADRLMTTINPTDEQLSTITKEDICEE